MAAFAPIPSASETMATAVTKGVLNSVRRANLIEDIGRLDDYRRPGVFNRRPMPTKDPRIDAYIEKAKPFARPILKRIRKAVHTACPDATETLKWSMPAFDYKGPLVGMAAFKAHCALAFWKASVMTSIP